MDIPSEDEITNEACLEWILGEIRMVYDEGDKHMMIDRGVKLLWWWEDEQRWAQANQK